AAVENHLKVARSLLLAVGGAFENHQLELDSGGRQLLLEHLLFILYAPACQQFYFKIRRDAGFLEERLHRRRVALALRQFEVPGSPLGKTLLRWIAVAPESSLDELLAIDGVGHSLAQLGIIKRRFDDVEDDASKTAKGGGRCFYSAHRAVLDVGHMRIRRSLDHIKISSPKSREPDRRLLSNLDRNLVQIANILLPVILVASKVHVTELPPSFENKRAGSRGKSVDPVRAGRNRALGYHRKRAQYQIRKKYRIRLSQSEFNGVACRHRDRFDLA